MSANLVIWYLTIVVMVFVYWLMLFYADQSTSKFDTVSWIILLIAPWFWPIVLPISSWELSRKSLENIWL